MLKDFGLAVTIHGEYEAHPAVDVGVEEAGTY
jgi:hypothetical protein